LDGFPLNFILGTSKKKSLKKIQFQIKLEKNKGHFKQRPKYIYDNISPNFSGGKNYGNAVQKNRDTHFVSNTFLK
jgi:hypothetical protein